MERFVNAGSCLTNEISFKLKRMRARGISVRITATNQSAQTLAVANMGSYLLQYAQRPRISANVAQLSMLNDYMFGENIRASATAGAVDMNIYIPFRNPLNPLDTNVVDLTDDDYIVLPGLSSTIVSAATASVYIDEDDSGDAMYRPSIYTRSQVLTSEAPIFLPDRNLYMLLGAQPTSTVPTKMILAKGAANSDTADKVMKLDVPYEVAENFTKRQGRLEPTSTFDGFVLQLGSVDSCLGQDYELQLIGGAGTFTYTIMSLDMIARQGSTTIASDGTMRVVANSGVARTPVIGGGSIAIAATGRPINQAPPRRNWAN